jgi:hypothetical protein
MYHKLRQVDLEISKHIYIDIFDNNKLLATFSTTKNLDYCCCYIICSPIQEKYINYLINNGIIEITYTEALPNNSNGTVGHWVKLTTKALLNVL